MVLVGTPDLSKPCNQTACRLPDCLCSDTKIPGGMPVGGVPQMVVLSFQGAVNDQNYQLYRRLFDGRHNPNGCPVTGSFYVSHEWTNYYQVQSLYSQGHEIGDRAVTEGSQDYWSKATSATWAQQIKGNSVNTKKLYGNVCAMLNQRQRRWADVVQMFCICWEYTHDYVDSINGSHVAIEIIPGPVNETHL